MKVTTVNILSCRILLLLLTESQSTWSAARSDFEPSVQYFTISPSQRQQFEPTSSGRTTFVDRLKQYLKIKSERHAEIRETAADNYYGYDGKKKTKPLPNETPLNQPFLSFTDRLAQYFQLPNSNSDSDPSSASAPILSLADQLNQYFQIPTLKNDQPNDEAQSTFSNQLNQYFRISTTPPALASSATTTNFIRTTTPKPKLIFAGFMNRRIAFPLLKNGSVDVSTKPLLSGGSGGKTFQNNAAVQLPNQHLPKPTINTSALVKVRPNNQFLTYPPQNDGPPTAVKNQQFSSSSTAGGTFKPQQNNPNKQLRILQPINRIVGTTTQQSSGAPAAAAAAGEEEQSKASSKYSELYNIIRPRTPSTTAAAPTMTQMMADNTGSSSSINDEPTSHKSDGSTVLNELSRYFLNSRQTLYPINRSNNNNKNNSLTTTNQSNSSLATTDNNAYSPPNPRNQTNPENHLAAVNLEEFQEFMKINQIGTFNQISQTETEEGGQVSKINQSEPSSSRNDRFPAENITPVSTTQITTIAATTNEILENEEKGELNSIFGLDFSLICNGPTSPDTEGPFYIPDSPIKIVEPLCHDSLSMPLVIKGRVLNSNCKDPVKNAIFDVWQANPAGQYSGVEDGKLKDATVVRLNENDFDCRGSFLARSDGSFQLNTAYPGLLPGRPRHIHFKVTARGYQPLTSQIYFDDDPYRDAFKIPMFLPLMLLNRGCDGCNDHSQIAHVKKLFRNGRLIRVADFDVFLKPEEADGS